MSRLVGAAHSDVGRVRTVNQDGALVSERLRLFAVADGMGGHRAGEIASALALSSLRSRESAEAGAPPGDGGPAPLSSAGDVVDAVLDANEAVFDRARSDPDLFGMGTTLCLIALVGQPGTGDHLVVANVGDSRVYVLAGGELAQLTEDHSLVADMVRGGHLTPEEAASHPKRNILTRALGIEPDVVVDYWERPATAGERYLLCSDGLFNEVSEARIGATLRQIADAGEAARELVELANAGGGRDNITCLVVDVVTDVGGPELAVEQGAQDPGPTAARALAATLASPRSEEFPSRASGRVPEPKPKRFTFRLVAFVIALAAVGGAAYLAIRTFARNNYFVAVAGEEVAIFRGRPGGVLWFEPEVAKATAIRTGDLTQFQLGKLDDPYQTASLDDAQRWVDQQLRPASSSVTPSTTTTVTSTTAPTTASTTASTTISTAASTIAPAPSAPPPSTPPTSGG